MRVSLYTLAQKCGFREMLLIVVLAILAGCSERASTNQLQQFIHTHRHEITEFKAIYSTGEEVQTKLFTNPALISRFLDQAEKSSPKSYLINTRMNRGGCNFLLFRKGEEIGEITLIKLSTREGFVDFKAQGYANDSLLLFAHKKLGIL